MWPFGGVAPLMEHKRGKEIDVGCFFNQERYTAVESLFCIFETKVRLGTWKKKNCTADLPHGLQCTNMSDSTVGGSLCATLVVLPTDVVGPAQGTTAPG